jgi:hypothetical protein
MRCCRLDATELEDISSCIALPDMDMPDVLSLLADDGEADGDLLQELELKQQQQQQGVWQEACSDAADGLIWPEMACRNTGAGYQAPAAAATPPPAAAAGTAEFLQEQALVSHCGANTHAAAAAADMMPLSAAAAAAAAGATGQLGYQLPASTAEYASYDAAAQAAPASAGALPAGVNNWWDPSTYPAPAAPAGIKAEEWTPTAVDSAAMHINKPPSSTKAAAAAAAAAPPGKGGKASKPKRKPSEAQRQAHKRFRMRRKEQVGRCYESV